MGVDPYSMPLDWKRRNGYAPAPATPRKARGTGRRSLAKAAFVLSLWKPDGTGGGTCFVPVRTVSEMNARDHWTRRNARRAMQHEMVRLVMSRAVVEPPCVVTMTRVTRRGNLLDDDNLASAMKFCRDAIAKIIGVDDGDRSRVTWVRGQARGESVGVRVEIKRRG